MASQAVFIDAYVEEYISVNKAVHIDCFDVCFHYSFSYCYFLVVHLHHDHLVTTLKRSHILTNTLNNVF